MDEVFRALNDPSRRLLLDRLLEQDGQTVNELCTHLPSMTRFGVMAHLRVLEEAALVTAHKVGRSKHHYLNPVPIRQIHDRWITKFTEPVVGAIAGLRSQLEARENPMDKPIHRYQTFIRCRPEELWRALVNGDDTSQYYYGTRVSSDWAAGSPVAYTYPDGSVAADGTVIAVEDGRRLEMSFHPRWDPEIEAGGPVRMVWLIEQSDGMCKLTVEHHGLEPGTRTHTDFTAGIPFIVAGLKTLLETGEPLATG